MITPATLVDAARELLALARLEWRETDAGVTLVATGTDDDVRADVWAWASAFGLAPTVVEPEPVHRGWSALTPGWIVVQLPVIDVTVIGMLHGKKTGGSR